jgi:glycine cleavage system aminomethyltransferase T
MNIWVPQRTVCLRIDDLVIYKFNPERFLLINNAGNHDTVTDWFWLQYNKLKSEEISLKNSGVEGCEQSYEDITMEDVTSKIAQIAVQGPLAKALVNKYLGLKET